MLTFAWKPAVSAPRAYSTADRDNAADRLEQLLHKHHARLPLAFGEELLATLAPAESITLSEAQLIELILARYGNLQAAAPSAAVPGTIAQLHEIRKRAKLARYLAESAPRSATAARRLAAQFERLQQAGGEWHDWLVLAQVANGELSPSGQKLPQRFAAHAAHALGTFRSLLIPASSPQ